MEYTIQKLAELAGVTTRTLRWYHRIGLLKPSRVGGERLPLLRRGGGRPARRTSCYYRALGVELARIRSNVWMIPPLTGWPRCAATWPRLESGARAA